MSDQTERAREKICEGSSELCYIRMDSMRLWIDNDKLCSDINSVESLYPGLFSIE